MLFEGNNKIIFIGNFIYRFTCPLLMLRIHLSFVVIRTQISYYGDLNCIKRISVSMFQTNDMMHEQQIEEGEIKMFCQFREWRMKRVKDEES